MRFFFFPLRLLLNWSGLNLLALLPPTRLLATLQPVSIIAPERRDQLVIRLPLLIVPLLAQHPPGCLLSDHGHRRSPLLLGPLRQELGIQQPRLH